MSVVGSLLDWKCFLRQSCLCLTDGLWGPVLHMKSHQSLTKNLSEISGWLRSVSSLDPCPSLKSMCVCVWGWLSLCIDHIYGVNGAQTLRLSALSRLRGDSLSPGLVEGFSGQRAQHYMKLIAYSKQACISFYQHAFLCGGRFWNSWRAACHSRLYEQADFFLHHLALHHWQLLRCF